MDLEKRSAGFGAAIILFAVLLRLLAGVLPQYGHALRPEQGGDLVLRVPGAGLQSPGSTTVVPPATSPAPSPPATVPPVTVPAPTVPPQRLQFGAEDVGYIQLKTASGCHYYPDLTSLLLQPLSWDLDSGEPAVLIYHSHACEAYTREPGDLYTELVNCRTTDPQYNMLAVGDMLAQLLEKAGIRVIHDRQLHDEPSYSSAYTSSRRSVAAYLEQYPSIRLVLDLHRDAATLANGKPYATSAAVDGQAAAQFMLVMGTDSGGANHDRWQENLSVALKLQVLLEQQATGITRPTQLRGSHYNQDLSAGALLIEVGASGNTRAEVARALPLLANAIIALKDGATN